MLATELIEHLAACVREFGDIEVTVQTSGCCDHGHKIKKLDVLDWNEKVAKFPDDAVAVVLRCE